MARRRERKTVDLVALRARGLERCTADKLVALHVLEPVKWKDGEQARADEMFRPFVVPPERCERPYPCVGCGEELAYNLEWAIAHGEAHCMACGYPARVYHYGVPGQRERVVATLQYHPDDLQLTTPHSEDEED